MGVDIGDGRVLEQALDQRLDNSVLGNISLHNHAGLIQPAKRQEAANELTSITTE